MGLSRTNGRKNTSHAARLAALAGELTPVKPPWWVDQPGGQTPAQGWYWVPAGARHPAFLGHNAATAEMALRGIVDALG